MTQKELDTLVDGDVSLDELEEVSSEETTEPDIEEDIDFEDVYQKANGYSEGTTHHWSLPPTDENKMVYQLDDVTKESEEKVNEIFDIIENISNEIMATEEEANKTIETLSSNIELFQTLTQKFPDVAVFSTSLAQNEEALVAAQTIIQTMQYSGDEIVNVMGIIQYQDIHHQKIEHVINVMRAHSKYMNTLFEGKIDDKRVSSAEHTVGDTHNDVASDDDIEALLAKFGK